MSKKNRTRPKHIPQRTCVGCRTVQPKRAMTRLVRTPEGIQVDPTGKLAGRGAYVHNLHACWEAALRGSLARALKTEITAADRERLVPLMDTLAKEPKTNTM